MFESSGPSFDLEFNATVTGSVKLLRATFFKFLAGPARAQFVSLWFMRFYGLLHRRFHQLLPDFPRLFEPALEYAWEFGYLSVQFDKQFVFLIGKIFIFFFPQFFVKMPGVSEN